VSKLRRTRPIRRVKSVQATALEQIEMPREHPLKIDRSSIPAFSMEHILLDITGEDGVVEASVSEEEELEWSLERPSDGDWGSIVLESGLTCRRTPFETDEFGLGWPHSFRRRF